MSMYGYLFRRLLGTIPVMLVVAVFIFLMLRLTPSDPAAIIAGDNANAEQVAKIRGQLGLDRPMIEQFVIWSGKVLTGDFGESFFFKKPVARFHPPHDQSHRVAMLIPFFSALCPSLNDCRYEADDTTSDRSIELLFGDRMMLRSHHDVAHAAIP